METTKKTKMSEFGLIGKNIDYSFSRGYFNDKFEKEKLAYSYVNFDIHSVSKFPSILKENPRLIGLNVTIPYKESIMPYLDYLSPEAKAIGAVNTIKLQPNKKLIGYNTDYYGFQKSIKPLLDKHHTAALILGTGGASKAIAYAFKQWNIPTSFVSRNKKDNILSYDDLNEEIIRNHSIIVNTTPLGTYPNIKSYPNIPYSLLTPSHLLYDLTYNPSNTLFMQKGSAQGAKATNGYMMLVEQAEKAWDIWQNRSNEFNN